MNNWYIYKITNLLNGKSYIGQRRFNKDIIKDSYMGSGLALHFAFKKYGIENFKKEILKDGIHCQTAANIFEAIYIKKENTLSPNGYNLKSSSMKDNVWSEESKDKMRGDNNPAKRQDVKDKISKSIKGMKYPERTIEHRKHLSDSQKGIPKSDEACKKMSTAKKGKPGNNTKPKSDKTKQKIRDSVNAFYRNKLKQPENNIQ